MPKNNLWGLTDGFILASGSPQRLRLLEAAGFPPSAVITADIDETPHKNELPARYVKRIAIEKARAVAQKNKGQCILAADTVIAVGVRMIRKATTREEAFENLKLLSGRKHRVITGFCVVKPDGTTITKTVTTFVIIKKLDKVDIEAILDSGQWQNVAGYQIEGMLSAVVRKTIGSFPNVVGLPIFEVAQVLRGIL